MDVTTDGSGISLAHCLRRKTDEREMIDMPLDDRVLSALERNPYIARRSLRFETNAGRVTLRGVVGTYFQKQMAQEALRHVDGVHEIANELEVCWR
jgi:osmotically-inducible protein OsmY